MSFWQSFPTNRLMAEISLWSADFTRFGEEIARVDRFADLYHIDVSDAHFVPGLLLFPDLVAQLRPLTRKPFHVHLMTDQPLGLVDEFAAAGADLITVHAENGPMAPAALGRIRERGKAAGLVLGLGSDPASIAPFFELIELVVLMGTPIGVKGCDLSPFACGRITRMQQVIREAGYEGKIKVEADGGIRTNTVPNLRAAGADLVVMGSLAFKSPDLQKTFDWAWGL